MSLIYIKNSSEKIDHDVFTYAKIYQLLQDNEKSFNDNQKMGIRYQLLKTILRKHTKNYIEKDLINITMNNLEPEKIVNYLNNSILGIENINKFYLDYNISVDYKEYINKLYISLTSDRSLLHRLIFDTNQTQISVEMNAEVLSQVNAETTASVTAEITSQIKQINNLIKQKNILINEYKIKNKSVILHENCQKCKQYNCTPLFKQINYMMINNKPIYISYNLLADERLDITYFCFVEFSDMILIENEKVGIDYYIYRLPVYNYNGELILFNPNYNQILIINIAIVNLLGINNYLFLNTDMSSNTKIDINKLTENSILILGYHYIVFNALYSDTDENADNEAHDFKYNQRYNFSIELLEKILEIQFVSLDRNVISEPHNTTNMIEDNTIDIYTNNIVKTRLPIYYITYKYEFSPSNELKGAGNNTQYRKSKKFSKKKITKKNHKSIKRLIL
jgi:hypothetical protein